MNASEALKHLDKLDEIHRFILNLELEFAELNSAKKSLAKALIFLVFYLEDIIDGQLESDHDSAKILSEIDNTQKLLHIFFAQEKIKNSDNLLDDLAKVFLFVQNHQTLSISDALTETNDEEIKNLRRKILLITAERFG